MLTYLKTFQWTQQYQKIWNFRKITGKIEEL